MAANKKKIFGDEGIGDEGIGDEGIGDEGIGDEGIGIGFDLGGTKMLAVAIELATMKILARKKVLTVEVKGADKGEQGMAVMAGCVRSVLGKVGAKNIKSIGIGAPGVVDARAGKLIEAPNLGWRDLDMRGYFEKEFACEVSLCNDADAGTYGEYKLGEGRGAECLLGVFPGTGLGAGLVWHGHLFTGARLSCMELGHVPLPTFDLNTPEGKLANWEMRCGRLAIAAEIAAEFCRGRVKSIKRKIGTRVDLIKSSTIAKAIAADDEAVEQVVANACLQLGIAVAGACNMLSPDVIVLGGGLPEAMPDFYIEHVGRALRKHALPHLAADVKLRVASLGDDAVALGAALAHS